MFFLTFHRKNRTEAELAADKKFLQAVQRKKTVRVIDGALYQDAAELKDKVMAFKQSTRELLKQK
jgi:hypothetical protein